MLDHIFGGDAFVASTRALDAASLRQQVIAHNLSNANTPGFKKQEVQFETQLGRALAEKNRSGAGGLGDISPRIVTNNATSERSDGNNVDMEVENVLLAENTLRYEALTQCVSGYFGGLKTVINGR